MEKRKETRRKRLYPQSRRAAGLMFATFLAVISLAELIAGSGFFSESGNRPSAQKPKLTLSGIADGEFMEKYGEYRAAQFPGRKMLTASRAKIGLLGGRRESNGIFRGKDSYLLEDIRKPDPEELDDTLKTMKEFRGSCPDVPFYMMLVPGAANVLAEKLPVFAVTEDQTAQFEEIRERLGNYFVWVDAEKALKAGKKEEIYYHTDSRWTTLGAYYAYKELAGSMGFDTEKEPELKPYTVTGDFSGALSSSSGYAGGYRDSISIYSCEDPEDNTKVVVTYVDENRKTATLYDSGALKGKDKYDVFFGGDFPVIDIQTAADAKERLLIVKDSHANCLVPFLVPYFREIVMVDPEFYTGGLRGIMEDYRITSVLFLYGGNTFMEDNAIRGVLTDDETE